MARYRRIVAAAVAIVIIQKKTTRWKRKCWVRDWILKRFINGVTNNLIPELKLKDTQQFINFTRMSTVEFELLLSKVAPVIAKKDTQLRPSISPTERLLLTFRFLASDESYHSLTYLFRIPVCTIARIVPEVCRAIYQTLKDNYLKLPQTRQEWLHCAENFDVKWNFRHCIGCIDGKHFVIKAPKHSGSYYFNYKGCHSIVLMIVADALYKITYMNVGCNGRVSDGGVFQGTSLYNMFETNLFDLPLGVPLPAREKTIPYVLRADDAFAMKTYLMKPYPSKNQPVMNRVYNYRLSRARRIVESVFGILASRFRILRRSIDLSPDKVVQLVSAICVLHNFIILQRDHRYDENCAVTEDNMPEENLLPLQQGINHNSCVQAKEIREEFKNYFMTPEGEVSWQYKHI